MSADYQFRPDLKTLARRDFLRARRMDAAQSPKAIEKARLTTPIEAKAYKLAKKLKAHIDKHKSLWVRGEEKKLGQVRQPSRLARAQGPTPPMGAVRSAANDQAAIRAQARANVNARLAERRQKIETIAKRMTRDLTRTRTRSR